MKKNILFLLLLITFGSSSLAQDFRSFNFLLFIDNKLVDVAHLDFIIVDTLTHEQDTVKCSYFPGDVKISEKDLEKIMKADSIYTRIVVQSNSNYKFYRYNIPCYKKFYEIIHYYLISIYNLNKDGTKFDYSFNADLNEYCVMGWRIRKKKSARLYQKIHF